MKKLDIRFDTEKVSGDLNLLARETFQSKSGIARAAMNIGLDTLKRSINKDVLDLIEEYNLPAKQV